MDNVMQSFCRNSSPECENWALVFSSWGVRMFISQKTLQSKAVCLGLTVGAEFPQTLPRKKNTVPELKPWSLSYLLWFKKKTHTSGLVTPRHKNPGLYHTNGDYPFVENIWFNDIWIPRPKFNHILKVTKFRFTSQSWVLTVSQEFVPHNFT